MAIPLSSARRQRRAQAMDEAQLLELALEDDGAARRLLEHVGPAVLRTVRGVVGPDDAELDDLVQDSLVALLDALPAYRGEGRLRSFATGIAAKVALTGLRRRHRKGRVSHHDDPSEVRAPLDLDAELATEQRMALVRACMARVPRAQAEALTLRWMLGHSLAEIAEITGAPVNTVRSRLRLGRNALVERLREHSRASQGEETQW